MPRLFTGLEIPDALAESFSLLRGGIPGARWIEANDYHITLSFIGDIDLDMADEVVSGLENIHVPPFSLRVSGFDSFGNKASRAIYAGIDSCPELNQLQKSHEIMLRRIGVSIRGRNYVPHITLARTNQANQLDIARYLSTHGGFVSKPFEIHRFALFSAKDSIGGGPYQVEEVFDL